MESTDRSAAGTRRRVEIGPLALSYLEWGAATAEPLLLLHGFGGQAESWAPVAERYLDRYRVIAPDARGHGESDWAPDGDYRYATFAEDLERFCAALELERILLIGHSMGGLHATPFTARHPERVRALVLVDVGPRPRKDVEATAEEYWKIPVEFESREAALDFLIGSARRTAQLLGDSPSGEALRRAAETRVETELKPAGAGTLTWRGDLAGLQEARRRYDPLMVDEGQWPEVERIRRRTLLIRGGASKVLHASIAERMAAVNPNLGLVVVEGVGHAVHLERKDHFCELVDGFFAELERQS